MRKIHSLFIQYTKKQSNKIIMAHISSLINEFDVLTNGETECKKILMISENSLGDTILFALYHQAVFLHNQKVKKKKM